MGCKRACNECPFKKTSTKGWLGTANWREGLSHYLDYISFNVQVACHMTVKTPKEHHCYGMIHHLNASLSISRNPIQRHLQLELKTDKIGAAEVFNWQHEFKEHHNLDNIRKKSA